MLIAGLLAIAVLAAANAFGSDLDFYRRSVLHEHFSR